VAKWSSNNLRKITDFVEVELHHVSESVTQGIGEWWEASGGTNEGKSRDIHLDTRRTRPWSDHDIDLEVFHRRVEYLLDLRFQSMDLVDEENFSFSQTREKRDDICLFLDRRSTRRLDTRPHLMCDDGGYRRLPESGRSIEEDMLKGILPDLRTLDCDLEMIFHRRLSDIFIERARTQRYLTDLLFFVSFWSDGTDDFFLLWWLDRHVYSIWKIRYLAKWKNLSFCEFLFDISYFSSKIHSDDTLLSFWHSQRIDIFTISASAANSLSTIVTK